MSISKLPPTRSQLAGYLALLLLLLLVAGLFSISFTAGAALLLGILLAWPVKLMVLAIIPWARRMNRRIWIGLALFIVAGLVGVCLLSVLITGRYAMPVGIAGLEIAEVTLKEYQAVVEPAGPGLEQFQLVETVILLQLPSAEQITLRLPARPVNGSSQGFLLREVSIRPLQAETSTAQLTLANGHPVSVSLCCPAAGVELRDLPQNSFYAARDIGAVERVPYLDTETIRWSLRDLERGITFAYIPPPYHHLRPVLAPFVGLSSFSGWVIALLGMVGTVIVAPVVESVVSDLVKERVKAWVAKVLKREVAKKPPALSGEGPEK